MIKVILKRGREESLLRFHPWVFSGAIAEIQGSPAEGDMVAVHALDGSLLAYGHYQIGSIAVRVLSFDDSALHTDFWENTLARALAMRVACGLHVSEAGASTNCYRLVHGVGVYYFSFHSSHANSRLDATLFNTLLSNTRS